MGIVAVLMLPALAMLAGGGSMETLSRDRESASRIARAIISGAGGDKDDGQLRIDLTGGESFRLLPAGGEVEGASYLLFDEKGLFLAAVGEGEYERGLDPQLGGRYFVKIRLSDGEPASGLKTCYLSVEYPAAASRDFRSAEIFQTRLAIP